MVQTVWLTQAGKSRLEEELQDLRTRRETELHARIQEATESGDISDNSEYEELKDEWASLEARIFELEQTLGPRRSSSARMATTSSVSARR